MFQYIFSRSLERKALCQTRVFSYIRLVMFDRSTLYNTTSNTTLPRHFTIDKWFVDSHDTKVFHVNLLFFLKPIAASRANQLTNGYHLKAFRAIPNPNFNNIVLFWRCMCFCWCQSYTIFIFDRRCKGVPTKLLTLQHVDNT